MKRSAIALGATVLALALHAVPAAAQTADPGQQIGDSTGAAQVGAVQADVPVRVLSDGDNAEPARVTAAPQDSGDSTASGQVEPANVSAPIRVLSNGDDGTTATAADTTPSGDPPTGDGTVGDTVPAVGGDPADTAPAVDELPALDPVADAEPGGGDGGTLPDGGELLPVAAGDVAGDSASGELPLTGLAVASLVLTGMALLTGGSALHCLPSRH